MQFVLPLGDQPLMNVPALGLGVDWETRQFLLVPSASVFWYYSAPILHNLQGDKEHVWRIAVKEFLVIPPVSFVPMACDGVSLSKPAIPRIVTDGLEIFVPKADRLACYIADSGLFAIVGKAVFYPEISSLASFRVPVVGWSFIDLEDTSFSITGVHETQLTWQTNVCMNVGRMWTVHIYVINAGSCPSQFVLGLTFSQEASMTLLQHL